MACGVVGIFGVAASYNLLFIYTAELFPTVVRNAALGCTAQAAQMGAIVAPLVVVLGERVPFEVFGASGIICDRGWGRQRQAGPCACAGRHPRKGMAAQGPAPAQEEDSPRS